VKTELSANWRWRFRGGERAGRRRLLGVDGGAGALLRERERCGEGNEKWVGELVWQARGVLKTRPAASGSPWRVASSSRRPATSVPPRGGEVLKWSGTVATIQRTMN